MKFLFFLLFFLARHIVSAQDDFSDYPFTLYSEWSVVFMNLDGSIGNRRFLVTGAEVINDTKYYHIEVYDGEQGYSNVLGTLLVQYDNDRYYRYDKEMNTKTLIYDFSLTTGDTFYSIDGEYKVIDKTILDGFDKYWNYENLMPQIILEKVDVPLCKDMWFYGIGSLYTGVAEQIDFPDTQWTALEYKCDNWWNVMPDIACFSVNTQQYKSIPFIPLPVNTDEPISEGVEFEMKEDSLLITGMLQLEEFVYNMRCVIHGYDIFITMGDIPYIKRVNPGKGKVLRKVHLAIPDLPFGTLIIHYEDQPPLVVDNNAPTGLLDTFLPEKKQELFSLTGRRLTHEPARGMYIKDGRKYLKR